MFVVVAAVVVIFTVPVMVELLVGLLALVA